MAMFFAEVNHKEEKRNTELVKQAVEKCLGQKVCVKRTIGRNYTSATYVIKTLKSYNQYPDLPDYVGNFLVASFSMDVFPGCCAYAASYETNVTPRFRGKGIGTALQEVKAKLAKEAGFTHMLATCKKDNITQISILEKAGWEKLHDCVNKRTNNQLILWIKDV